MNRATEIKKLWDQAGDEYDKHMAETGHYDAQLALLEKLNSYFKSPILDLAGGPGFLSSLLLMKNHEVTLNDFSSEMIKLATKNLKEYTKVNFSNQDATQFTFNKKFKTIVICNLFYYLQNRDGSLLHWKEYLEENGVIIFFEEYPFQKPNTENMDNHTENLMKLIDPLSPNEMKEIFERNNLTLIKEISVPIDQKHDLFGFVVKKH